MKPRSGAEPPPRPSDEDIDLDREIKYAFDAGEPMGERPAATSRRRIIQSERGGGSSDSPLSSTVEPEPMTPPNALNWKIGPSGAVGPDGYRLLADVWCAVGLYRDFDSARTALQLRERTMPFLEDADESWHAVLMPFAHKGECNHLDRDHPGTLFDVGTRIPMADAWSSPPRDSSSDQS